MSGMGGNLGLLLQFILQSIQQWMIVYVLSCFQVLQQNLGQVCISAWLFVKKATPSNCGKLLLNHWYRSGVERSAQQHHGETHGHGKNPMNRDNPQPSPTSDAHSARSWMQFRDLMSVGHQGINVRTNKHLTRWHKIKSVPLEIGLILGIFYRRYPVGKESVLGSRKRADSTLAYSN